VGDLYGVGRGRLLRGDPLLLRPLDAQRAPGTAGAAASGEVSAVRKTLPSFEERAKRATRNWKRRAERLLNPVTRSCRGCCCGGGFGDSEYTSQFRGAYVAKKYAYFFGRNDVEIRLAVRAVGGLARACPQGVGGLPARALCRLRVPPRAILSKISRFEIIFAIFSRISRFLVKFRDSLVHVRLL